jgi:hypothetical protein
MMTGPTIYYSRERVCSRGRCDLPGPGWVNQNLALPRDALDHLTRLSQPGLQPFSSNEISAPSVIWNALRHLIAFLACGCLGRHRW